MERASLTAYPIRRIVIGDPKGGMSYTVGQSFGNNDQYKITRIVRHEDNFELMGCLTYIIYGTYRGGDEKVFKYIENQPVIVECDMEQPMLSFNKIPTPEEDE